jgi:nucleoside-diphosphate-sugar epimerase
VSILRILIPPIKEMKELKYQVVQDYWFDSSKFEKHFNFTPTSMEAGIRETIRGLRVDS